VCLGLATVASGVIVYGAVVASYGLGRELWLLAATGYSALGALFLAMSVSPFIRVVQFAALPWPRPAALAAFRRAFGITAASFALLHASLALSTYLWDAWAVVVSRPFYRSGAIALLLLTALLLTSFPRVVSILRIGHWKALHRLAYAAVLLVLHHLLLSPFAPRMPILIAFGLLFATAGLRLLPARRER